MRTLTTVEHVERKDSGAIVVTFLGGNKAGTYDPEVGDTAEEALRDGHSVELQVDKRQGKLFIEFLSLVLPPEELGGPADEPSPDAGVVEAAALVEPFNPVAAPEVVDEILAAEAATDQVDDTAPEAIAAAEVLLAQPNLGLATTAELLTELQARAEVGGYANYKTYTGGDA
jgi:hypothetical protein